MDGQQQLDDSQRSCQSPKASSRFKKVQNDNETDEELSGEETSDRRKRQKLTVSCELCKQRKVKCDRGQPSCGWCTRNGAICEYKERKKPGLRAGYGRELEQRLDRLEEVLSQHSRVLAQSSLLNMYGSNSGVQDATHNAQLHEDYNGTPDIPSLRSERAQFAREASSVSTMPGTDLPQQSARSSSRHLGIVSHQAQITPPSHSPHDHSGSIGTSQVGHVVSQIQRQKQSPSLNSQTSGIQQVIGSDDGLPPYDLLYGLVDLYFKHVNPWAPILHRRSTFDLLFGSGSLTEADRILLHAIVATTLRFSTDSRLTKTTTQHYHSTCKQKVLLYGLENSSVKSLQALVILAMDLVGSSNGPPGWNVLALITRSVVQLGLAVETSSLSVCPTYPSIYTLRATILPEAEDWREEESRRRLFWMVYLLDRYATIATAFEFALSETEIERRLPCRDALFEKNVQVETRWFKAETRSNHSPDRPENLGSFAHYIQVLGILSDIHIFLKQRIDISALEDVERWQGAYRKLDNMLTEWKFNLPVQYGNIAKLYQTDAAKNIKPGWVMLHATYHTAIIRLHSSAAYPTTRSPIFAPSYSASQRCHTAVEHIATLGEWVVQNDMLAKLGPPFAFTLWVSARLLLVHGSTIEHKLSPQIYVFVEILRSMGRYWDVARRYAEIIQRVLDEYKDNEHTAVASGERIQGSVVGILADMRRTAYDLDFLISRHPRKGVSLGMSKLVTPIRPPVASELEYLDVFDFFNLPRLPIDDRGQGDSISTVVPDDPQEETGNRLRPNMSANEFNITNFMVDANSDWLFNNRT